MTSHSQYLILPPSEQTYVICKHKLPFLPKPNSKPFFDLNLDVEEPLKLFKLPVYRGSENCTGNYANAPFKT